MTYVENNLVNVKKMMTAEEYENILENAFPSFNASTESGLIKDDGKQATNRLLERGSDRRQENKDANKFYNPMAPENLVHEGMEMMLRDVGKTHYMIIDLTMKDFSNKEIAQTLHLKDSQLKTKKREAMEYLKNYFLKAKKEDL